MQTVKIFAPLALVLAAAACSIDGNGHGGADVGQQAAQTFSCQNGFVVAVKNAGQDKVALEYGLSDSKSRAVLSSAVSGSGERYVSNDKKTEWHQKGGDAILSFTDPYGNVTETSCQAQ